MSTNRSIQKMYVSITVFIFLSFLIVITNNPIFIKKNYFVTPYHVYGQQDQINSNNINLINIHDIATKNIQVGDIDIAYKTFGKGEPILLISGASADMNAWESSTLGNLSSNHTLIVFDNRGIGNTTTGTKPFSIQQLANDTAGLLDALKIQKADVLGYSLGATIAQQLTFSHPDKVNRLILVGASCGGKEGIPPSPQLVEFMSDIVNKSLNNIPVTEEEIKEIMSSSFGSAWVKLHPNSLENIPTAEDVFSAISPNTMKQQFRIGEGWMATNWDGICDELTKILSPTLIITGTHDNNVPSGNSLIIAEKIPGAWLVQIKDGGHALFAQYPDIVNRVLETFLSTTESSG